MSEQIIENKKLKRAGVITLVGAVSMLLFRVLGAVLYMLNKDEMARQSYEITKKSVPDFTQTFEVYQTTFNIMMMTLLVIIFALLILVLIFALGFKKAKGRGKAITVIVISSIFILLSLMNLFTSPIDALINIAGFGLVLAGSIMAVSAPTSEYEYNRLD